MRAWRERIQAMLTIAGILLILVPVVLTADSRVSVIVVLVGIFMIEAGVWGLAQRLLPEEREYIQLRTEVDNFLNLVRQLNRFAVAGEQESFRRAERELHGQVERIAQAAGKSRRT